MCSFQINYQRFKGLPKKVSHGNCLGDILPQDMFREAWPRGTDFSYLPSAVISTVAYPLGSELLLFRVRTVQQDIFLKAITSSSVS